MKVSFEIARNAGVTPGAITGAALRPPYAGDALRVRAEDVRAVQEFVSRARMERSYDAASVDNFNSDFKGTYGSANTEMFPATYAIRARGRTLAKDTAHGKGLVRTYADNVVGDDPFELEMEVGKFLPDGTFEEESETNRAIEQWWRRFCRKENFTIRRNMDFMEAMRLVEMARVSPGSVICREHFNYPSEFGFAVDFLEQDRLQEQFQGQSGSDGRFGAGNPIRASREYHPRWNYPIAYWILTRHPGEFYAQTPLWTDGQAKVFREQVPADEVIEFSNLRTRPEQDIGMTELDATILPLWRIHQYDKSLTLSSIASASKPWWIEEAMPTGMELPSDIRELIDNYKLNGGNLAAGGVGPVGAGGDKNPAATQQGNGAPANVVRPASREKLPAGMTLKQADPRFPIEAAHEFRLDNLRDISVATHGSYQQATGDYQNLGFIAGLMSQQAFQRHMRVRQKSLIEDLRRLFKDALRSSIARGYFDRRGVYLQITRLEEYVDGVRFKGQQAEFVNPLVQAQSLILLEERGHMSRQGVQDSLPNGMKVDKLFAQIAAEKREAEDQGITFATSDGFNDGGGDDAVPDDVEDPQDKGKSKPPSKSKKAVRQHAPTFARRRMIGEIDATTRDLIQMSTNGEH